MHDADHVGRGFLGMIRLRIACSMVERIPLASSIVNAGRCTLCSGSPFDEVTCVALEILWQCKHIPHPS